MFCQLLCEPGSLLGSLGPSQSCLTWHLGSLVAQEGSSVGAFGTWRWRWKMMTRPHLLMHGCLGKSSWNKAGTWWLNPLSFASTQGKVNYPPPCEPCLACLPSPPWASSCCLLHTALVPLRLGAGAYVAVVGRFHDLWQVRTPLVAWNNLSCHGHFFFSFGFFFLPSGNSIFGTRVCVC